MLVKITPDKNFDIAYKFLQELPKRYEWFCFEFGKTVANYFYDLLSEEISGIRRVPKDYKKRLVVAEIRDSGAKYWFAVAVKSVPMRSTERREDNTVIKVISRFPGEFADPAYEILQSYGPWTVDMLPYIPARQSAIIVAEAASAGRVEDVRQRNKNTRSKWMQLMIEYGIEPEIRSNIPYKLKIIEDLEKLVNEMEFGVGPRWHPHWAKALRKTRSNMIRMLLTHRDLLASMTDPKFKKYRVKVHLSQKLRSEDVRNFEKFQKRLLKFA